MEVGNGFTWGAVITVTELHILNDSELTQEQLEMVQNICELSKKKEKILNVSFRNVDRKQRKDNFGKGGPNGIEMS